MDVFSADELDDLDDALSNLIQDKRDYCRFEEGADEQIDRLKALKKKLENVKA
ncbi:hypothetical protein [Pseudomonas coronafaciens]|uniref:hypothetical protein n=1 Tax=Pseudomonas coronafaciens TaxID=53409 RepID=UPI0013C2D20A|nr:hypothetical protein [Pseudomonas coronafaciens]